MWKCKKSGFFIGAVISCIFLLSVILTIPISICHEAGHRDKNYHDCCKLCICLEYAEQVIKNISHNIEGYRKADLQVNQYNNDKYKEEILFLRKDSLVKLKIELLN